MVKKVFESTVKVPVERLAEFHKSSEALKVLTPPDREVEILTENPEVTEGSIHTMRIRQFGVPMVWKSRITRVDEGRSFVDEAIKSPFAYWKHTHEFLPLEEGGSLLRDTVEYKAPFGPLGTLAHKMFIDKQIEDLFRFRHRVTKEELESDRV
ncbi:MAG: SRPBCC family protein [Fimbriimonadaceae bacterium]